MEVAYFFVVKAVLPEPPRGLQDALHRMTTRYQRLRLEQRRAAGAKVRAAVVGTNGDAAAVDTVQSAPSSVPLDVIRDELEMPLAEGFDYRTLTEASDP